MPGGAIDMEVLRARVVRIGYDIETQARVCTAAGGAA
jgi:hypothetical protein